MSNSPGRREVAHRLFAAEYDDASLEYAESDEERAPNYVVTPTGARINRLFAVGVLTSVEQVNEDTVRARIADPTGAFVVYAGQYQPDELAALQSLEPPAFVAITGKANTFQPDGSDRVLTSIRPESVTEVDAETRDRWVVTAAEHTLGRIETVADGLTREERGDDLVAVLRADGVEPGLAEGVARAIDHYDTTADYLGALRELSLQAVEVVAGDRSEAESLDVAPGDETGQYAVGDLVDSAPPAATAVTEVAGDVEDVVVDDLGGDEARTDADSESDATATTDDETVAESEPTTEPDASADEEASPDETAVDGATDDGDATTADSGAETTATDGDQTETAESGTAESAATDSATTTTDSDVGGVDDFDGGSSVGADADLDEADDAEGSADTADEVDAESSAGNGDVESSAGNGDAESSVDEDDASPDEMYEVDEEERERIEEEYGVGFESGTEVGEPGEAGIDAPTDPEAVEANETNAAATETGNAAADDGTAAGDGASAADASASDAGADEETADAAPDDAEAEAESDEGTADEETDEDDAAEDVDLESVLLEQMEALDDGDGAERGPLVEAVVEETGADEDAVEDAIEDALMSGQCYEPGDGTYKPI